MAIQDFNEYVFKVNEQVIAAKEDLKDFEQGLKDGYITEDKLIEIKEEYEKMDINLQRLLFCSYLLSLPKRKRKQKKYKEKNPELEEYFKLNNADIAAVLLENKTALDIIRAKIKELKTEIGETK